MATRTGNFPIGFRRIGSEWQKKDLKALAQWARSSGFDHIDLNRTSADDFAALHGAGLKLGSADLVDFGQIMSKDPAKRKDVIAQNVAYVKEAAAAGAKIFFTCIIPDDVNMKRPEAYALAVESFAPIAHAADEAGARIAIEGWPGRAPQYANLCCTPETYRSFIKDLGAKSTGVNYDPSHLIRLGVDPIRFLKEFAPKIWHVHAKDTELIADAAYEFGIYQGSAFVKAHGFGEHAWRYTIPGHGITRWSEVLRILKESGYSGVVSVELEDENFNGSEDGEKAGLLHSLAFLKSA